MRVRNLALMWVLAGVALVSVSLYVHSETIDSADADYCIDWKSEKTEFDSGDVYDIRLVLVKRNNNLKYTQKPIQCISSRAYDHSYSYAHSSTFYFIDKLGKDIFSFEWSGGSSSIITMRNDGRCSWRADCSEAEYLKARTFTLPTMEINFPPTTSYMTTTLERFKKDDLLRFKNKIINAQIEQRVSCKPDLDTTYRVDFRARITGECGCDSIKERRK